MSAGACGSCRISRDFLNELVLWEAHPARGIAMFQAGMTGQWCSAGKCVTAYGQNVERSSVLKASDAAAP